MVQAMRAANLRFRLFAGLGLLLTSGNGAATSIVAGRPHDPREACRVAAELVDDLRAGKPRGSGSAQFRQFYSDELGAVSSPELEEFAHSLLHSEGKPDNRPMRIYSLMRLGKEEPYYILTLERSVWKTKSYETNDMLLPVEVDDPHWELEHSSWLIRFRGNEIASVRQANELFFLHGELERVTGCPAG